jgi:peptide/nickel transport system substrate-binding protein
VQSAYLLLLGNYVINQEKRNMNKSFRLISTLMLMSILVLVLGSVSAQEYGEAPMLAEMVTAGTLPPVAERLPVAEDIMVVTPVDGIGQYGGTWHNVSWAADIPNIKMILYDPPIRWKSDYTGYEPGLAKAYEWSEDGTQVTLHFREGVKWSDGEPFTMADLQFWWTDMALNEDFKVVQVPWWGFNSDGTPMDVAFPDDYTMVMTWDRPQWITPFILAQGFWEWEPLMTPRHYLEQFHPTYNSSATYEELEAMRKWWENPDFPTLFAWHVTEYVAAQTTTLERNPYYWKTDTEGNQLPYIDRMIIDVIPDEQVRLLELSQGKYEASFRGSDNPVNIPFLAEQGAQNGFHLHPGAVNGAGGWPVWLVNQDYSDTSNENWEEIRMVLRDKTVRQAFSYAMDRQRIIDVAWGGIGTPQQGTISPQAWHFVSEEGQAVFQEWANAYVEHDPDLAMQMLDEAGLVDADGDGCRDLPSGAPFTLVLDLTDWGRESITVPSTEVYSGNLNEVGICTLVNNVIGQPDSQLRQDEGLYMLRNAHASELDIWTYPDWIFPLRRNRAWPKQGYWRETGGAEGEEPLEGSPAQRLQALYDQGVAEPDVEKRHEIVWEAIRIHIEEGPFMIGAAGDQGMPVVIGDNFHGVPELVILGPWAPGSPGNLFPEQFWIEQ